MLSTSLLLAASMVVGQADASPNYEHLKAFDGLVGTWVYEGPLKEDVPDVATKDTPMAVRITWEWTLNKAVVEGEYMIKFKDLPKIEGKRLFGWNAADNQIVWGHMNSLGVVGVGNATFSEDGKTLRIAGKGIDGRGNKSSGTIVIIVNGDTFVWQNTDREGDPDLGSESPKYTFQRVKRDHHDHDHEHDEEDD